MPGGQLFPWEELPRNSSRVDVLEWYIEIANEMNLSCFGRHYSNIDRLKAEANKGKKKWVNPILARCLSIIHHLVSNYLNGGDNVESPTLLWLRKRTRINPAFLVPKSIFIESSINSSSKEIQSSTSTIKQVPEFEKCRCDKGEVIVDLQSVFDGAFPDMKIKTISKQVFDISKKD